MSANTAFCEHGVIAAICRLCPMDLPPDPLRPAETDAEPGWRGAMLDCRRAQRRRSGYVAALCLAAIILLASGAWIGWALGGPR